MSLDHARGCLLGLACGDALGRPVEFQSPERIRADHGRVTEMLGYGTHGQPAGTLTDDTDMALCIARSLAEQGRFDPADVADRFVSWLDTGPFDVGLMTRDAVTRLRAGGRWQEAGHTVWEDRPEGSNAGNGSLMRCAPYAIAFAEKPQMLASVARKSSAITHADPRCADSCAALTLVVAALLREESDPLRTARLDLGAVEHEVESVLDALAKPGTIVSSDLSNTGYVIHTLEAGLYHGLTAPTAEDAIVDAVSMGGDADTIGAVAGAVAGARFGATALPSRWTDCIGEADELESLATTLWTESIGVPDA